MGARELVAQYWPQMRRNWLPLSLGILGVIFFVYGLIGLFSANSSRENIVFEANSAVKQLVEVGTILIDVEGSVVKPGVYKIPSESRIQDALVMAGGLAANADRNFVARNFNLATKLTDGAKIYVPAIEEEIVEALTPNSSSDGINVGTLININSASEIQLDTLPGVGPATAQKIASGRPYASVDELLSRKMVGAKVFDQIKGKVTIY